MTALPASSSPAPLAELRLGRWQDALADVGEVDAIVTDPPYSARTHDGHDDGANLANRGGRHPRTGGGFDVHRARRSISYASMAEGDVEDFMAFWAPRCAGWFVVLSDSDLCATWRAAFERHGLTGFQPLPLFLPGMTVRMAGDGPSSWAVYANVARPKALVRWGTLPGGYTGPPEKTIAIGGKPLWLMRALVRDYTRPGDLVCDPCAGGATTLLAASMEGRRSIGAEMDPATFAKAKRRLEGGYTPDLFLNAATP